MISRNKRLGGRIGRMTVVLLLALSAAGVHGAERRPNLLFILTDDQRWDTAGFAGNRVIQTPHMDALATGGVYFRNAFVTTSICAASRASVFTGLYERTHRYTFNTPPIADRFIDDSYPVRLREAGYRTGFVGKFGVGVERGGAARMFDSFEPLNRSPYFKEQSDGSTRHVTDLTGDRAIEFLESAEADDRPWSLSVSFNAPHAEDTDPRQFIWPPSADGLYSDTKFPEPESMADAFFRSQPAFLRESESRVRFHWRFDEREKYQEMVRGYYRMITGVDSVIGRLRAALAERGMADNTVIILLSDNGYFLGERGFADKWYIHEHSVRVPLVIFDPRAKEQRRGVTVDLMALNVDIAPTLLSLAGVEVPPGHQGRDLTPLMRGEAPVEWRTDFFYEHLFERWNIPKSEGVRDQRWTYVRWFEQEPVVEELYDHQVDFEQVNNLVDSVEHAPVLERLRRRTDELRDRWGGPYTRNYLRKSEPPNR